MKHLYKLPILLILLNSCSSISESETNLSNFKKFSNIDRGFNKTSSYDESFLVADDFTKMCFADEAQFIAIDRSLNREIVNAFTKRDFAALSSLFSNAQRVDSFITKIPKVKGDDVQVTTWKLDNLKKEQSSNENFKEYLSKFSEIKDIQFVTKKVNSRTRMRDDNFDMQKFTAEVFFELSGFASDNSRRIDRGYLEIDYLLKDNHWVIDALKIVSMETLQKKTPTFKDATQKLGLDQMPSYLRKEAIRRGGYTLALSDMNNDSFIDMFVGSREESKIFLGNKNGKFEELIIPEINQLSLVKSAVWADFDNDGFKDLLIVRFVPGYINEGQSKLTNIVSFYQNKNGKELVQKGRLIESRPTDYAMPASVADFDNDGLLDVYIGYPGHRDFTTFHKNDNYKADIKAQGVYLNKGDFLFAATEMAESITEKYENFLFASMLYPHSSLAADINQDGKVDILVIDDRGNLSPLYLNQGNAKFSKGNSSTLISNYGYGMGAATADFNNDGLTDLVATSVTYSALDRMKISCSENWSFHIDNEPKSKAISLFVGARGVEGKSFSEQSNSLGLVEPGEGLAGIEFLDYDNDGFEDIYITNGLWSGTDRFQDMSSEFVRTLFRNDTMALMEARNTTNSIVMQTLLDYEGDISDRGQKEKLSLAGHQRNKLYRNNQKGGFVEVGFLEGVDSIADGYVVAKADINNDGKIDLVLRNADPGSKRVSFPAVEIFQNEGKANNYLRVLLVGNKNNKDAIGAEVTIKTKNGIQTKQVIANSGTVQSELALHFGLGDLEKVESLTVKWPSGKKEIRKNISKGTYTIKSEI